jgi:hypothetical protein
MDSDQSSLVNSPNAELKAPSHCPQFPRHPNARTSSCAAVAGSFVALFRLRPDINCAEPAAIDLTSIHLRTPVLRGPPAIRFA